jgi:hypothetical protein
VRSPNSRCFIIILIIDPRKIFKPQLKQGGGYL